MEQLLCKGRAQIKAARAGLDQLPLSADGAGQGSTIRRFGTQLQHLLVEAARDGDMQALKHKLDDFLIGHEDLSLRIEQPDGTVFYRSAASPPTGSEARRLRFELPSPLSASEPLTATLMLDTGDDAALLRALTPRQSEVLRLMCDGLRNKEISEQLNMTEKTVKTHVSAILGTLGVLNRTQATLVARRGGVFGKPV